MNKRALAIVVTLTLVIIGAVAVYGLTRTSEPSSIAQAPDAPPAATAAPEPAESLASPTSEPQSAGAYVDYDESAIAAAKGTVLLFFHAPWCPQCRSIESDILADGVPAGVTIVKVDYDSNQNLRQQYGVTLQTTFVEVDSTGSELQKYVASENPTLAAVVAAML